MKKAVLIGVGILVALAVIGNLAGTNGDNADTEGSSDGGSSGSVTLLAAKSLCLADPGQAKIHFRITLRNDDSDSDVSVDATPWRRYSDNSVNDSSLDGLTMDVSAGATTTFRAEFGYDAEKHSLIECGVKMEGDAEPTRFAVVNY